MLQENIELHRKLNIVRQENTELQNKVHILDYKHSA